MENSTPGAASPRVGQAGSAASPALGIPGGFAISGSICGDVSGEQQEIRCYSIAEVPGPTVRSVSGLVPPSLDPLEQQALMTDLTIE